MRTREQHMRSLAALRAKLAAIPEGGSATVAGRHVTRYLRGFSLDGGPLQFDSWALSTLRPMRPKPQRPAIHRIQRFPEKARKFIAEHRRILAFFAENGPDARVTLAFGFDGIDQAHYREANMALLDRRINETGGSAPVPSRDEEAHLLRDQKRLAAWPSSSSLGLGLESRIARRRFPEIHAAMRERLLSPER